MKFCVKSIAALLILAFEAVPVIAQGNSIGAHIQSISRLLLLPLLGPKSRFEELDSKPVPRFISVGFRAESPISSVRRA